MRLDLLQTSPLGLLQISPLDLLQISPFGSAPDQPISCLQISPLDLLQISPLSDQIGPLSPDQPIVSVPDQLAALVLISMLEQSAREK